jgi:triosephosphate isomerase
MIVAANFKTNLTRSQTKEYLAKLEDLISGSQKTDVYVFPATSSLLEHQGKAVVGVQNAYPTRDGAFTGEIGLVHLEEFGIKTILIGHSERRHVLQETQADIAKKYEYFMDNNYTIIYCIGEMLAVKEQGLDATLAYIDTQLEGIDLSYEKLIVAYEPVWAIGTGLTPSLEEIEVIHQKLKEKISAPILYGGSVKVNNAQEIMGLASVDGVLVGSASLHVEDFAQMVQIAENL